ncbi:MAG TPA: hypothetical protein VIV82_11595, partial [Verrucomicrobiae bacterium]
SLKTEDLQPPLRLDGEIEFQTITLQSLKELERLRPTGQGNPGIQFCARNLTHKRPLQRIGSEKQHVKMWVTNGVAAHEAVWWGGGKNGALPVGQFDLAFAPQINSYNGQQTVQLKVLDWQPSQT